MLDFKIFFDSSPNAAMVLDRSLRIVAANPAYLQATGVSNVEAILGRHVFEAFPNGPDNPDNPEVAQLRASFERVFKDGVADVVPLIPFDVGDGRQRFWSASHMPIKNAAGEVDYVLQLTVDVTELTLMQRQSSTSTQVQANVLERAQQASNNNKILHADRERLLRLFDHAPAFVAVLRGKDHVFELTNTAYQRLVGRDVVGMTVAAVLPEVEGQGLIAALDAVFQTGTPFEAKGLQVSLAATPTLPAREVILDFSYQPIVESDGVISGIFVLGSDITHQTRLELHNERLSEIVSQSSKCMAIADITGAITYVNDAGRRLLGLTSLEGVTARTLYADDAKHVYDDVVIPALLNDEHWQAEVDFQHVGTGMRIPVHHNTFVLRDKVGRPIGTASITRDLTIERAAQQEREQLAEREQEARRVAEVSERQRLFLAESIPQQVWTAVPGTGLLDFVNERVVDYFGYPAEELLGAGWLQHVHDDDKPRGIEAWQKSLSSGEPYEVTFRLKRHDGCWRWYLARAVAFRDDAGDVIKWFGTNTDIDDATLAREELQKRTEFEQQLIGIVSHDLRNPLNAIALSAAILDGNGTALDDKRRAAVGRIMSSTSRATRMISDLLDFSQARSAGTIPVYPEKTSLRQLVSWVVDELGVAHTNRQITMEHTGEELVIVDPDRMTQVVGNLVGNALQHSEATTAVAVRSWIDGDTAFIEVKNTGVIADEDMPRLFEPFQQGSGARGSSARSVGLGLYIASRIVDGHGGTIEVASTEAEGTRFLVRFPRHRAS